EGLCDSPILACFESELSETDCGPLAKITSSTLIRGPAAEVFRTYTAPSTLIAELCMKHLRTDRYPG
ncbi:MAG TPA: hypothetical protein PLY80_13180, partial [Pseudomonadota bacterium]|nr:hypothetical protein [Pseudomonadota bacterium]